MSTTIPLSNLQVSVACGPVPCDTEEGRSILQKRQALFGQICFLLSLALFTVFNLVLTLGAGQPWLSWVSTWNNQVHLGITFAFLVVFLMCRAKPLNRFVLAAVDVVGRLWSRAQRFRRR